MINLKFQEIIIDFNVIKVTHQCDYSYLLSEFTTIGETTRHRDTFLGVERLVETSWTLVKRTLS